MVYAYKHVMYNMIMRYLKWFSATLNSRCSGNCNQGRNCKCQSIDQTGG